MKKKNTNLPIKDQISKLEKAKNKHGDPSGTTQSKIDTLRKQL